jgi:hypothetical protein
MRWVRRTSSLDARSASCLRRAAFVNGASRLHVRNPSPGSWLGGLGRPGEGTVPTRSCRAAAVPARAQGSVDAASRDLQVGRRVGAAHLEQLTARVAELGGRAVQAAWSATGPLTVGWPPATAQPAAASRCSSRSGNPNPPASWPVGPKGLVVARVDAEAEGEDGQDHQGDDQQEQRHVRRSLLGGLGVRVRGSGPARPRGAAARRRGGGGVGPGAPGGPGRPRGAGDRSAAARRGQQPGDRGGLVQLGAGQLLARQAGRPVAGGDRG